MSILIYEDIYLYINDIIFTYMCELVNWWFYTYICYKIIDILTLRLLAATEFTYTTSADQVLPGTSVQSDHGLHCLLFNQCIFLNFLQKKTPQKTDEWFCPDWKMSKTTLKISCVGKGWCFGSKKAQCL
jgi:hypothetical protein